MLTLTTTIIYRIIMIQYDNVINWFYFGISVMTEDRVLILVRVNPDLIRLIVLQRNVHNSLMKVENLNVSAIWGAISFRLAVQMHLF